MNGADAMTISDTHRSVGATSAKVNATRPNAPVKNSSTPRYASPFTARSEPTPSRVRVHHRDNAEGARAGATGVSAGLAGAGGDVATVGCSAACAGCGGANPDGGVGYRPTDRAVVGATVPGV